VVEEGIVVEVVPLPPTPSQREGEGNGVPEERGCFYTMGTGFLLPLEGEDQGGGVCSPSQRGGEKRVPEGEKWHPKGGKWYTIGEKEPMWRIFKERGIYPPPNCKEDTPWERGRERGYLSLSWKGNNPLSPFGGEAR